MPFLFPHGERRGVFGLVVGLLALLMSLSTFAAADAAPTTAASSSASARERVPFAVIGDSDSQGFQDLYPEAGADTPRGGLYHAATFQWTEALAKLRGDEVDLGDWGVHGMSGRLALGIEWLGLSRAAESRGWEVRAPIKRDHRHNFAYSGDGCAQLFGGWSRQVPRLIRLMDREPGRWDGGVVVIKIGNNDFSNDIPNLDRLAADPASPEVRRKMDSCLADIGRAVAAIHQNHPRTRIVLVGTFDNAHWEKYRDHWHSPAMLANISKGLDHFDDALQRMAEADKRLGFFSDRKWFDALWGSRDQNGLPNYRTLTLAPTVQVTNTGGDAPTHATLTDGHTGLVWNAKWAQALIEFVDTRFGLRITPISDAEVLKFIMATGDFRNPK